MKKLLSILASASLLFATPSATFAASDNQEDKKPEINIIIYGTKLTFDVPPVYVETPAGDVTMVEFRTIFDKFGLDIGWDGDTQTVKGKKKDLDVELQIGNKKVKVNGQEKELQVAPFVVDGHTMVPLRFVGEVNGGKVEWDDPTKTVTIAKAETNKEMSLLFNGKEITSSISPSPISQFNGKTLIYLYDATNSLGLENSMSGFDTENKKAIFKQGDKTQELDLFEVNSRSCIDIFELCKFFGWELKINGSEYNITTTQ